TLPKLTTTIVPSDSVDEDPVADNEMDISSFDIEPREQVFQNLAEKHFEPMELSNEAHSNSHDSTNVSMAFGSLRTDSLANSTTEPAQEEMLQDVSAQDSTQGVADQNDHNYKVSEMLPTNLYNTTYLEEQSELSRSQGMNH